MNCWAMEQLEPPDTYQFKLITEWNSWNKLPMKKSRDSVYVAVEST